MLPDHPILIVDDDEGVCRLLTKSLEREGLQAVWKTSGASALDWIRQHRVPLMLLDLRLEDMNGPDVLASLAEEGRSVPFVVVSGAADVRIAVDLMKEGALDFLPKDSQLLELVAPVVRRCLEHIEQQQRLAEVESRFLQLANTIQSVFWISSPNMTQFYFVSPAYATIWESPVQTLYERPASWLETVLPADIPILQAAADRLRTDAGQIEIEFRILRPGGEIRWLQCTASPIRNEAGLVERLTGIVNDITERKEINRRLLATAEEERRRLGQDLHDDLCQRLAAIKMRCSLLERSLTRGNSPLASVAAELAASIGETTALSRSLARGLSPVALDADGLSAALEVLTKSAATIFGTSVRFECPSTFTVSNPDTATHLYRIAQELISNAAKHARPTRILVQLQQEPDRLILEVNNDGAPFQQPAGTGDGMGLHLLRSRADAIGANLSFLPGAPPNGGTRALCILPLSSIPAST